jgi:hypothetical protein
MRGFGRPRAILTLIGLLALLLAIDAAVSRPPDPFAAPPPLALWSGEAASGGFCGAPTR